MLDEGVESRSDGVHRIHWKRIDSDGKYIFLFVRDLENSTPCLLYTSPLQKTDAVSRDSVSHFSTSFNMMTIFDLTLQNRKCSSPGIRIYSNLIDTMASIGTPFHPLIHQEWNFLSLSRIEKCTFHRNLFASNGSDGLHRNDFPPPHPT